MGMTQTSPPDISSRMSAALDEPVHDDRHGGPGLLREVIDDVLSKTLFDSPLGAARRDSGGAPARNLHGRSRARTSDLDRGSGNSLELRGAPARVSGADQWSSESFPSTH
jgi:hypothetical protein